MFTIGIECTVVLPPTDLQANYDPDFDNITVLLSDICDLLAETGQVVFRVSGFTGVNAHDELSFEDSAKIITGHVNKGIEIAKKHNLPDALIDFIRTHHGTTKAQYFYISFLKSFPDQEVDESIFRYPGPIPFSKETAVLMMADSVEAASRSLKKYDAEIIGELVEKVIDRQIEQNQFVNADITFKNINSIKKIFKKKLLNIHHLRIEYPK